MITVTPDARDQILMALKNQEDPDKKFVRVEAKANGAAAEFSYGLMLISEDEKNPGDQIVQTDGFEIVVDESSARNLQGATIDFEDRIVRSGFKFDNPNKPESPSLGEGPRPDLTGPTAERVQQLLDTELNPAVAAHGGMIQLIGVRDDKVFLSFGGGCHGCGMVDVTLKHGVESRIKEVIPEITEVVDTTDHDQGTNPFYA